MIFRPGRFFCAAAFAALAGTSGAVAQDEDLNTAAERMAACLEIEDSAERLACFETGAVSLSQALDDDALAETPSAPPVSEPMRQPEIAQEPAPSETAAATAPATAETSDTEPLPEWATVQTRPEKTADTPDELKVSIVRILRNSAGRHFFIMSDGQEWEQTMKATVRPPSSLPAAATIESSLVGSPRLTFDDGPSGAYKVRRTK